MLIDSCKLANRILHEGMWICIHPHTHAHTCARMFSDAHSHELTHLQMHIKVWSHRHVYPHTHTLMHILCIFLESDFSLPQKACPGLLCSWPNYSYRPPGCKFFWGWFACVTQGTDWKNWGNEKASSEVMITKKASQLLLPGSELETRSETRYLEGQVGLHKGGVSWPESPVYGIRRMGNLFRWAEPRVFFQRYSLFPAQVLCSPSLISWKRPLLVGHSLLSRNPHCGREILDSFIQPFSVDSGKLAGKPPFCPEIQIF